MENIEFTKNENKKIDPTTVQARKDFMEQYNVIPINEFMGYKKNVDGNIIGLYIAPSFDLNTIEKIRTLKNSLVDLASIVNEKKEIEKIIAVSWLIERKPELARKLGFTVDDSLKWKFLGTFGKLNKDTFGIPKARVGRAFMSRDDLLKKYLDKKV